MSVTGTRAAAFTSAAMIANQVAGKAARDSLFLTSFPASALPGVMAVAAVLSLVAALWIARLLTRFSPSSVLPVLFGASICGLVGEWGLGQVSPAAMAIAIYLHLAVFGPLLMTAFWSLINERFDPHSARHAVARIATGGTIGGVLGALMAWRAAAVMELSTVVLLLAALHGACVIGTLLLRSRVPRLAVKARASKRAPTDDGVSSVQLLRTEPYLRNIAFLVALVSATSSLLDYLFSFQASASFDKGPQLLTFFSLFWLAVAVLSLVIQLTVGERALDKLPLTANIAILPGLVVIGALVGVGVPGFLATSILRGAEAVQRNTLFRSAYELLYTPLSERHKRSIKAPIDIGFDRAGTIVASGVIVLFLALFSRQSVSYLLGVVVVLGLLTLAVVQRLHGGYVTALEHGLRQGATQLALPSLARPVSVSGESPEDVEREKLIQRTELLRSGHAAVTQHDGADLAVQPPALTALQDPLSLLDGRTLLAGDFEATSMALRALPLETTTPVAGFVILLLAHKQLHTEALEALRRAAPIMTGQLIDALVDPAMDFVVRRRIPYALAACSSQRAADGLLLGIGDDRFEVRYACGRALMTIAEANPSIVISRQKIVQTILIEVDRDAPTANDFEADPSGIEDASALVNDVLARDRVDRTLEHVFTILGLHLEREPMRMAYRALRHADVRHRGTALEYLQTILPHDIRDALWPLLGTLAPLPAARSAREILADLLRATVVQPPPDSSQPSGSN